MELTQQIVEHVTRAAKVRARLLNIESDIAVSLAYGYLVNVSLEVGDVNTLYAHVYHLLKTRLLADFYDEIRVYGPRSATLRQRRFRGKIPGTIQRASPEQLQAVETRNVTHDFDFLDRLDVTVQRYALLVLAGYTQVELIADFGYTRTQLSTLKQELSNVLTKQGSCRRS